MENSRRKFLQKLSLASAIIPFANEHAKADNLPKVENNKYEGKKL